MVPINNVAGLRWYAGCYLLRYKEHVALSYFQKSFTDKIVRKFDVVSRSNVPSLTRVKSEEFDIAEPQDYWPSREVERGLKWFVNLAGPNILNAVTVVARYSYAPKYVHRKTA